MKEALLLYCNREVNNISDSIFSNVCSEIDIVGEDLVRLLSDIIKREAYCFLEPPVTPRHSFSEGPPLTELKPSKQSFEDDFPSLSASVAPVPTQKKKKRIRSTLVSNSTSERKGGNISNLPSCLVPALSREVLKSGQPVSPLGGVSQFAASTQLSPISLPPPSSPLKSGTISDTVSSPVSPRSFLSHQKVSLDEATSAALDSLDMAKPKAVKVLGKVYGDMVLRQRDNRFQEISFLYQLLCCSHANIAAGAHPTIADDALFFSCSLDCLVFASSAFECLQPFLQEIDTRVMSLMSSHPILASLIPHTVSDLRGVVVSKRASITAAQRVRVGQGANHGVALPFRQETDSRHHFRSPEQGKLFVNRESCRDCFLRLFRGYRDIRHEFDDKKVVKFANKFPSEVSNLLELLQPANIQWFASLVIDHLAATALDIEADEEVHVAFGGDINKLENLSQRMSSTPTQAKREQFSKPSNAAKNISSTPTFSLNHTLGEPSDLFVSPGESFFFKFLSMITQYDLLHHIHGLLVSRITKVSENWILLSSSNTDSSSSSMTSSSVQLDHKILDGDETVDLLVSLRVFGRFLGWISFRPYWRLSAITAQASSLALDTAVSDAVVVESFLSSPPPLKPHALFRRFMQCGMLVLVIPWLADYLQMLKWDVVTRKTPYFATLLSDLISLQEVLRNAPRLNDNLTLVSIELELLFTKLGLLAALPCGDSTMMSTLSISVVHGVDGKSLIAQRIYSRHLCVGVEVLLSDMFQSQKSFHASNAAMIAKKVRPHSVSSSSMSPTNEVAKSTKKEDMISVAKVNGGSSHDLQQQMQVSFFRRYPELRTIADFVVNIVLRNCGDLVLKQCESVDVSLWGNSGARGARRLAKHLAEVLIREHVSAVVTDAMELLFPPSVALQVRKVALKLALKQVHHVGVEVIADAISTNVLKVLDRRRAQTTKPQQQQPLEETSPFIMDSSEPHDFETVLHALSRCEASGDETKPSFPLRDKEDLDVFISKSFTTLSNILKRCSSEQALLPDFRLLLNLLPITYSKLIRQFYKDSTAPLFFRKLFSRFMMTALENIDTNDKSLHMFYNQIVLNKLVSLVEIEQLLLGLIADRGYAKERTVAYGLDLLSCVTANAGAFQNGHLHLHRLECLMNEMS